MYDNHRKWALVTTARSVIGLQIEERASGYGHSWECME